MSFWFHLVLLARVATMAMPGLATGQTPDVQPPEQASADDVVIAVGGDVLPESSWEGAQDVFHFLDGMRGEFAQADLVFVNLEEPITSSQQMTPFKSQSEVAAKRDYILRARNPQIPIGLKQAGVGLVGLANNHMMDYILAGLRDTLQAFRQAGLPVVGAGFKLDAERPFIFQKHGRRVALLAFSDVVPRNSGATETHLGIASAKDERDLVNAIRGARRQADFVVLMMHWGGQGSHLITPRQRRLARVAAEAGSAVIVGMHPHVLQGIEYIGRVPVLYSIGNFAFASKRPDSQESVLVKLKFGPERLEEVGLVPVVISSRGVPAPAGQEQGKEILGHLDGFCRRFNSQVEGGRVIASSPRERLVYPAAGQKRIHPAARRPPTRRPSSHKSRTKKSRGAKRAGVGTRQKKVSCPLQFGVRSRIIYWFRRLA
jgi:poly-gamma-glutamate synthesis protein (capsule biosynthesis protein)